MITMGSPDQHFTFIIMPGDPYDCANLRNTDLEENQTKLCT